MRVGTRIGNAMGNMASCHMTFSRFAVGLLVVEKHIGAVGLKKRTLIQPPEKQGFIDTNIPGSQGSDDALVGRRRAGCYQCRAYGAGSRWKLCL